MRRVGCFVAESELTAGESASDAVKQLLELVATWLKEKGLPEWKEGESSVEVRRGQFATASVKKIPADADELWVITFDEPVASRRFFSRVCIGSRKGQLHLFVEMRAGTEGYEISPTRFDVRTPRLLPQLLAVRRWLVGMTMVTPRPIPRRGEEAGRRLWEVIRHADRNLPVIAISRFEGGLLSDSLADELARDLAGLALVYDLDDEASWGLTRVAGKEWSCFNGAIRVYWPLRTGAWSYRDNPLWTRNRLIQLSGTAEEAADRIRAQLRRWLFELSTYAVDEPDGLVNLRADAQRAAIEKLKHDAAQQGDYKRIAEELFERCDALETSLQEERGRLEEERQRTEQLEAQNKSLQQVWDYRRALPEADIAPDVDIPPASVAEAVARVKMQHADLLLFGDDVDESVRSLAVDAGPPPKIMTYLEGLAEMTRARNGEGLGKDLVIWLRDRGISCSNESETVLNNPAERSKRRWSDGSGKRFFERHLKPVEHTRPDRCVRIYFEYDEALRKTIIGYVGRHF